MRRAMLAGVAMIGLCGPALAFDFTPRTFRALYSAHFRTTGLLNGDLCGSATRDYTCGYGIEGKEPIASVSNMDAKSDRANSASLSWPVALPLKSHVDQLRAFVALCTPRADDVRRGVLVGRLLDDSLHPAPEDQAKLYVLDGARFSLSKEADDGLTVSADDLRMPPPSDMSGASGRTVQIK